MIEGCAALQAKTRITAEQPGFPELGVHHTVAFPFVFHCQVEALLASEDYGKDLASVNNLLKKHQLLEADISAHEVSRGVVRPVFGRGCAFGTGEGCLSLQAEGLKHCSLGATLYSERY